jgi:L-rhamnose mutarotase
VKILLILYTLIIYHMPINRLCLFLDLKDDPKLIKEYEHYHQSDMIWPEIIQGNIACGILTMDIYRVGNRLCMIIETGDGFDWKSATEKLSCFPRQQEWAKLMLKFQQKLPFATSGEHWVLTKKIFTQSQIS